jgi:uncharacterized membrane protein YeaQ/YmgE (transglycosylase-associated protein family)
MNLRFPSSAGGNPLAMHFIWFIIVGAIVGALGRLFHPGSDPMGWLLTIAIGIVSLLVAALISSGWVAFIIGVIVAVILVALVGRLYAGRGRSPARV